MQKIVKKVGRKSVLGNGSPREDCSRNFRGAGGDYQPMVMPAEPAVMSSSKVVLTAALSSTLSER